MLLLDLCIGYIEKMTKLDYDYGYVKLTKTCEDRDWKVEKIGAVNKLVYQAKVIFLEANKRKFRILRCVFRR